MIKSCRRIALAVATTIPLAAFSITPAFAQEQTVSFNLNPLKGTTSAGKATITAEQNGDLKVEIMGTGYVPNLPHAQHIHGDTSGTHFTCPGPGADKDGNGFISVEEGLPMYGNIHISLTTEGDTTPKSALALDRMPVADKDGKLNYTRTIKAADLPEGTTDALLNLHIVQHGVDANDNDEYDLEGLGESTFAKSQGVDGVPEEATAGTTCGMVSPHGGVETGGGDAMTATAMNTNMTNLGMIGVGALVVAGAGTGFVLIRRRAASQANR